MPDEEKMNTLHRDILSEFDKVQSASIDERLQCLKDRRFYSIPGAQWEGAVGEQFENKPKFEVNKILLAIIRIMNEYLNNRITVDFVNKFGESNDKMADTCDGLYRSDEQDSCAEEAYDNAFEEAIGGGIGAWRYRAIEEDEYDDDDECQRIAIEPIYEADSCVFFNLGCKRQDKADAKTCWVLIAMTPEEYKSEWDDDPATWPKEISQLEFDWATPDLVYIAEVYKVEDVKEVYHIYEDLEGEKEEYKAEEIEDDPDLKLAITAGGSKKVGEKTKRCRKVHKYIMSGGGILEDCGYIAGKHIPVTVVYGKRWFVDGIERMAGHVRPVKDAQKLKNLQVSKLGEISAQSSIEKPIFTPEQVAGHQLMWSEDNIKNYPYLLINAIEGLNGEDQIAGPVGYTKPPVVPPALAALLQISEQDIQDLLGNQQNAEEIQPNLSGKAIELIQNKIDMQSFIYMANMVKAVRRGGEIWLSMAKEMYIEEGRKMKHVGRQEEISSITLNRPVLGEDGGTTYENDMRKAKLNVYADVGPSSSSKRSAVVRNLTGLLGYTQDPETQQVLSSMIMMNMEGEGIDEVREYFRNKLIRMGVVKPNDDEAEELSKELANAKPDANETYLQSAAEAEKAKAAKARADTILTVAKAEGEEAKTELTKAQTKTELDQSQSETTTQ